MDIINYPPEFYLDKIKRNEPFSFSRIGDGEVLCMFPTGMQTNCDGSKFLKELAEPMKQIFANQYNYYHCFLDCSFWEQEHNFRHFLEKTCPNMDFYNGEIWQELSFAGRISEITEAVSERCIPIIVGGSHLANAHLIEGFKHTPIHLQTPDTNSYLAFKYIADELAELYMKGFRMFLFSTGFTTKILIDRLYPAMGKEAFLIDMGSVFDPYCGKLSRSGMRKSGYEFFQPHTTYKLK
jgi:hypothetical protein